MPSAHSVCRDACAAAEREYARLAREARRNLDYTAARTLTRVYAAELDWLRSRLQRTDDAPRLELLNAKPPRTKLPQAVRLLRHDLDLRAVAADREPLQHRFDAVLHADLAFARIDDELQRVERYTRDKVLLDAARELLKERAWASVHGLFPHTVLRPSFGGALVEAAAGVLVAAARRERVLARCLTE